jgi:hypothetical protein
MYPSSSSYWDIVAVGATTVSHEEDIFNQFLNPFLDKSAFLYSLN